MSFINKLEKRQVTIPNGSATSEIIDIRGVSLVGIITPAAYLGTIMTFKGSFDDPEGNAANLFPIYNILNAQLSPIVKANRMTLAFPADFVACTYIQFISDTLQTSDITLTLICRAID